MNIKALKILEYNKILEMLAELAGSEMAKERIISLKPSNDIYEIRDGLAETSEAVTVITMKGTVPIGELYDIDGCLNLARKGGTLSMRMLLQVLYNMKVAQNVVSFLKTDIPRLKIIHGLSDVLMTFPNLANELDRAIISEDEMADSASNELRNIRREIQKSNDAIRNKINGIINSQTNRTYLQDAIVTMRDGRYVVPVKAEHRAKINGIVHDQSSSGATLFIEPQIIVDLNNKLRELELKEEAEIARILLELSGKVAEHYHELKNNQKILADLDYIFAKGRLSQMMAGEEPEISEDGKLEIKEGRHPLIDKKKVVPINVYIGGDFSTLVITGPNTGGKTVTLKTIGLLSMMVQSGLHIPAASTSKMTIFEDIFADIGDEQSIEQSLSTFSSHMKNTVEFIDKAYSGTLVLLDELGAGTDPTEGAALAIAILEKLKTQGAYTVATTHYNELKKYAISTEGVENASMEFNVETLSPTYRLSIGVPGKSNAFEISKKLGLPGVIIERANQLLERGDIEFEDVLSKIEADKKKAESERMFAESSSLEAKKLIEELKRKEELLAKHEREILSKAKEEAREIIKEAKETATDVQKELKKLSKIDSLGERTKKLEESRRKLKDSEGKYADGISRMNNENPATKDDIKVGDKIKVITLDQMGEVISLPDEKGDVQIKVGAMKIFINLEDLMVVDQPKKTNKSGKIRSSGLLSSKAKSISTSINVIGQNLDDATDNVLKYLDDAYMAGLKEVTIIHGRGAGILQSGLRQMLNKNKQVASHRRGKFDEGGDGVTVVKFKD